METPKISLLFILFTLGFFKGIVLTANTPLDPSTNLISPSKDSIEQLMTDKSVWHIIAEANKYSYTDLNLALIYANIALEHARKTGNLPDIFNAQRGIAFIYEDNAMPEKYLSVYQEAAITAERLPDSFRTTIYNDLAVVNRKVGNFRAAYGYYEKVIDISQRSRDNEMLAGAYHGLGTLHREVGVYDKAIGFYLKSLEISQLMQSTQDIIVSHIDIAEAYFKAKEPEKAIIHIEKAYQLAISQQKNKPKDIEPNVQLASAANRYGEILSGKGDFDEALKKHLQALEVYQNIKYKSYIARTLMLVANVYVEQKKFAEASKSYKECLMYEQHFVNADQTELHFKIGAFYRQQHRNHEAESAFLKSLQLADKYDYKEIAQRANYQLFLLCFDDHENKRALQYLNQANALNDSLFNAEKARRTAEMELKFDTEKRENEFNAVKARDNRFFLIMSILVFLMIVLFLGYAMQMRGRSFRAMKLKNEEIQQQYKRLEESNEILSQFAYVVAHDLKEPLRSIGSYVGLIQMRFAKDLPAEAKDYMQFVNAGVKRMYSLLTDLLDFSQVISQEPGAEVIRPDEVLEDVIANLRTAIESRNALVECKGELPSLRMNRLHLLQLFQNLIGNALKFTKDDPVVTVEGKEENGHIILTIEDNGIGIKPEYRSKVFVLFQQLNKKGQFDGTGIGLTICKNIVEKYNGRIWFDSEENVGTKFYISIPAQAA